MEGGWDSTPRPGIGGPRNFCNKLGPLGGRMMGVDLVMGILAEALGALGGEARQPRERGVAGSKSVFSPT